MAAGGKPKLHGKGRPMPYQKSIRITTLLLSIAFGLGAAGTCSSQTAPPPFTAMPDIGFNAAPVDTAPDGLHFAAEVGPTGGPHETSEFFQGVVSTEALGTWAQRDSIFGLCFNQDHCMPTRLVPDRYDFAWTWEASYQPSTSSGTLIENNVAVTYADGTNHRPWAFDILTDQKAAVLNF